ncbi:hypothetical protein TcCL_NonESM06794 [Trypanosoma cruzi]|nr:hypothetical protein TcCL_NonESM06794 [Trypanosoma cruzi]
MFNGWDRLRLGRGKMVVHEAFWGRTGMGLDVPWKSTKFTRECTFGCPNVCVCVCLLVALLLRSGQLLSCKKSVLFFTFAFWSGADRLEEHADCSQHAQDGGDLSE